MRRKGWRSGDSTPAAQDEQIRSMLTQLTNQTQIMQVLSFTTTTTFATTSNAFTATNLTLSITPHYLGSRIRIFVSGVCQPGGVGLMRITIRRNGTNLLGTLGGASFNTTAETMFNYAFLDSPASTTSQVYDVAILSSNGVTSHTFGDTNTTQSIILEELA